MAAFLFWPARAAEEPEGVGVERWEALTAGRVMLLLEAVRWGRGARALEGLTEMVLMGAVPGWVTAEGVPLGVAVPFVSEGGLAEGKGTI